jgi:hypothetical protein
MMTIFRAAYCCDLGHSCNMMTKYKKCSPIMNGSAVIFSPSFKTAVAGFIIM